MNQQSQYRQAGEKFFHESLRERFGYNLLGATDKKLSVDTNNILFFIIIIYFKLNDTGNFKKNAIRKSLIGRGGEKPKKQKNLDLFHQSP